MIEKVLETVTKEANNAGKYFAENPKTIVPAIIGAALILNVMNNRRKD